MLQRKTILAFCVLCLLGGGSVLLLTRQGEVNQAETLAPGLAAAEVSPKTEHKSPGPLPKDYLEPQDAIITDQNTMAESVGPIRSETKQPPLTMAERTPLAVPKTLVVAGTPDMEGIPPDADLASGDLQKTIAVDALPEIGYGRSGWSPAVEMVSATIPDALKNQQQSTQMRKERFAQKLASSPKRQLLNEIRRNRGRSAVTE